MKLNEFILKNKTFALGVRAKDWKDAVKVSTDLLVKTGTVEERYYDAVIKITEEHGPYYVIAPGIAMPHARPESGALQTGFALVTLAEPVRFGHEENDPVDIILCICAKNKEDLNEEVIVDAVTLFDDEAVVQCLRTAKTQEDFFSILENLGQINYE